MKWKYEEQSALQQNNRVHTEAQHIGTSTWAGNIIISHHIMIPKILGKKLTLDLVQ